MTSISSKLYVENFRELFIEDVQADIENNDYIRLAVKEEVERCYQGIDLIDFIFYKIILYHQLYQHIAVAASY